MAGLTVKISGLVPKVVPDFSALPAFVAAVERWGADQVALGEHLLQADPSAHPGGVAWETNAGSIEPLTTLAAVAGTTSTVRLCTNLIGPVRPAILVAKMAATVDAISGGRLDLGLVPGWYAAEFDAVSVPLDERYDRLEELIAVCRALWSSSPVTFTGTWTRFSGVEARPRPVQPGGIPIWLGGGPSRRAAERVARLADGWMASEACSLDDIARGVDLVAAACGAVERDRRAIGIRATIATPPPAAASLDGRIESAVTGACALLTRGVTHVTLPLSAYATGPDDAEPVIRALVAALQPM